MEIKAWIEKHPGQVILFGFVGVMFALLILIALSTSDFSSGSSSKTYNLGNLPTGDLNAVKEGVGYEINEYWQEIGAEPICYEYIIDGNWLRLRCDLSQTKAGMQLTLDRIKENIDEKTTKTIKIDVAFKDNDYNTLEIFELNIN